MSLWRYRTTITRAIAGELAPAAERRLRAHLGDCAACRRHYDQLSALAASFGGKSGAERERARLLAALAPAAPAVKRPASRWAPLVLVPAMAAAALLLRARPEGSGSEDVAYRGEGSAPDRNREEARASLALRFYARKPPPKGQNAGQTERPPAVRLLGELPGSGELRASRQEELQIAYAGLTAPRRLNLWVQDDAGTRIPLYPPQPGQDQTLMPTQEVRLLGQAIALGRWGAPRRLRLTAVITALPRAGQPAAAPETITISAPFWIDP